MDLPELDNVGDLSEFGTALKSFNALGLQEAIYRLK